MPVSVKEQYNSNSSWQQLQVWAVLTAPYFSPVLWKPCGNVSCSSSRGQSCGTGGCTSHPVSDHGRFSVKTCPWSPVGAFHPLIYQGNKGWTPLGTPSSAPSPCWPCHVCALGCVQVGMALGSLSPSCHPSQGHSDNGWGHGKSNKGHPGAVSLSAELSTCALVCRAAEHTPGESGAVFLAGLSPEGSSELAEWAEARNHPGSESRRCREPMC